MHVISRKKLLQAARRIRKLRQKDLVSIFGTRSTVSEVMSGKREPTKAQVARLSQFFHVSPEVFF